MSTLSLKMLNTYLYALPAYINNLKIKPAEIFAFIEYLPVPCPLYAKLFVPEQIRDISLLFGYNHKLLFFLVIFFFFFPNGIKDKTPFVSSGSNLKCICRMGYKHHWARH